MGTNVSSSVRNIMNASVRRKTAFIMCPQGLLVNGFHKLLLNWRYGCCFVLQNRQKMTEFAANSLLIGYTVFSSSSTQKHSEILNEIFLAISELRNCLIVNGETKWFIFPRSTVHKQTKSWWGIPIGIPVILITSTKGRPEPHTIAQNVSVFFSAWGSKNTNT